MFFINVSFIPIFFYVFLEFIKFLLFEIFIYVLYIVYEISCLWFLISSFILFHLYLLIFVPVLSL